ASDALGWINENPLTINLTFPHCLPVFYDLVPASEGKLSHVEVEVEANHPVRALAPARTAVNQLLDTLMRVGWVPLVIVRLDVYLADESEPASPRFAVEDMNGLGFPTIKYAQRISQPPGDPDLRQKYFRLRRILCEFRSHSRGTLARYKKKIEHERIL